MINKKIAIFFALVILFGFGCTQDQEILPETVNTAVKTETAAEEVVEVVEKKIEEAMVEQEKVVEVEDVAKESETQPVMVSMVDCGSDMSCFADNVKLCKSAKVLYAPFNILSIIDVDLLDYFEVKGNASECTIYIERLEANFAYTQFGIDTLKEEGNTDEEIEKITKQYENWYGDMIGDTATCVSSDLEALVKPFSMLAEGSLSTRMWDDLNCNGEYFTPDMSALETS